MTKATATAAGAPVQGPAAPAYRDLIGATGNSRATLDDPHATAADRLAALEAEAAAYEAAKHLGVEDPEPDVYELELELAGLEPEAISIYGPQEATTADVVSAVADAELVTRNGGNYGAAWEAAQATSDNQWRSVVRQAQSREPEPEAGLLQAQARGHTLRPATPHVVQTGQPEPGPPEPEAHL